MQWNVWLGNDDTSADGLLARVHGSRRADLEAPLGSRAPRAAFVVVGSLEVRTLTLTLGERNVALPTFLDAVRSAAEERCFFFDLACAEGADPFAAADAAGAILSAAAPGEGWAVAVRALPAEAPHPLLRWLTDLADAPESLSFEDAYDVLASSSFSGRAAPALGRAAPSFDMRFGALPEPIGSARDLASVAESLSTPRPPVAEIAADEEIPEPPASMSIAVDVEFNSGSGIPVAPASMSSAELVELQSMPALEAALSGPNLELAARGSWAPWEEEAEALVASVARDPSWSSRLDALAERAALEPRRVESLFMRLVEAFAREGKGREAGAVCRRLAVLRRDTLHDVAGAIDAFRGAIRCVPAQHENHRDLADLVSMGVDANLAATCLDESLAAVGPELDLLVLRRSTLARLDPERAVLAGALAVAFGDPRFQPDADAMAAASPLRPGRSLAVADWAHLRHEAMSETVSGIFRVVEGAALAMRAEEKRLAPLDAGTLLDPQGTATIVRTVTWASQILGLPPVPVHHVESTRHDLIAHPGPPACVVVGPRAISGRSLVELSFLAARHLAYYLPGHRISLQFVSVDELAMLFWAALLAVREEVPAALREATATMRWRDGLRARLSVEERSQLAAVVARFESQGGRVDLAAWVRGLEFTANRLGLLLAGDPARVVAMVRQEDRRVGGLEAQGRLADLALWGASEAHAKLRRDLLGRA
jgi:hypothetical protein